jgi:hypothetical protein
MIKYSKMRSILAFTASLLSLVILGCGQSSSNRPHTAEQSTLPAINPDALRAHITFLAHDLLQGRDTGSEGYAIAAQYMVSHFTQYGLKPAGDNGSYLQQVTFLKRQLMPETALLSFHGEANTLRLNFPEDFYTTGSSTATETQLSAPMVFVGYGIEAPRLNHNDYQDLDVTNKIVVMLNAKPKSFPSEEGAHYASRYERARVAAKHGAIGMLVLQTPQAEQRYSYQRIKQKAGEPNYSWLTPEGKLGHDFSPLQGGALLSMEASRKLLADEAIDFDSLIQLMENQQPIPRFKMDKTANLMAKTQHSRVTSPNVVAVVEGTDPQLKNEYLVYSAHLDHIGIDHHEPANDPTKSRDIIYNGALDNASGSAILLETARWFAAHPPERSVLFIAVTGEERGLLGSDYFAHNPTVPIENLVANINLDMPLILYPIGDIIAFGAEHSSLGNDVQRAAEKMGLQLSPDPMPEQNIFIRSDHYSFVKQGVPAVFLVPGFKSLNPEINGSEMFQTFFNEHYHQPSDEVALPIDYEAGTRFTQVNIMIGQEIANSPTRPQWNENDFFGEAFGRNPAPLPSKQP